MPCKWRAQLRHHQVENTSLEPIITQLLVSNNYVRIEEVMPTAIGEECPILGMENFTFLPTVLVNIPTSRTRKFAMNEENLGIHICITKNGMKDEKVLDKVWLYWHWRIPLTRESEWQKIGTYAHVWWQFGLKNWLYLNWVQGEKQEANGDRYLMA